MPQCTATSKQSKQRCKRNAVPGRTVCNMHGGKTPTGPALPQFKHGKYSKDLPARLLERYEESLSDVDRLELTEEIAVIDARLRDKLSTVDRDGGGRLWPQIVSKFEEMRTALNDAERFMELYNETAALIRRGSKDYQAWSEVYELLEQRRRLVESERKRLLEAQQYVTVEKLMVYTAAVSDAIKEAVTRNISDQRLRSIVLADAASELRRLITRQDSLQLGSGSRSE